MKICYQADADLNQVIVTGVLRREPTVDFQTATAASLEGVKDSEVLAIAAELPRYRSERIEEINKKLENIKIEIKLIYLIIENSLNTLMVSFISLISHPW